ncbi:MAG: DUF2061 domain-containing protein [Parvibaculum sp.]|jgi:uncharacterized membrane protein|uniref:DUF2061 domain-containing protein n=1 Tax=Parvibaculum sp. TaxID=2024848 RepID=UPI00284183A4|nr:DUF2061 domain-containing protein [Parvibaculum sp.]MDR3500272.1 DUF2061 domain-containing protein [Parvibaculum sp.]
MRAARKAVSFSLIHFAVGLAVAFALTGRLGLSLGVALVEPAVSAVIHFFYEHWEDRRHRGGGMFHPA